MNYLVLCVFCIWVLKKSFEFKVLSQIFHANIRREAKVIHTMLGIFKRRLVAFKGGFVGRSVGPSVRRSVLKKFSKSFEKEFFSIK